MGNCLTRCFGRFDKRRKYLNTRYDVERETSIEFENLMDDEAPRNEMSKLVTEREKQLIQSRQYNALIEEQKIVDTQIDLKLQREEEELRREEEAYYEAKQEAARIAELQRAKEKQAKLKTTSNGPKSWTAGEENDWEIAGGEDDFEKFLAGVKARSLRNTAHLKKSLHLDEGVDPDDASKDAHSSSSSTPTRQTRERSQTDGSNSLDLEWEHEEGMAPQTKPRSETEEDLTNLTSRSKSESPGMSDDLEWDTEFTASEDKDTQSLLKAELKMGVR